jgi:hypothetical protein
MVEGLLKTERAQPLRASCKNEWPLTFARVYAVNSAMLGLKRARNTQSKPLFDPFLEMTLWESIELTPINSLTEEHPGVAKSCLLD